MRSRVDTGGIARSNYNTRRRKLIRAVLSNAQSSLTRFAGTAEPNRWPVEQLDIAACQEKGRCMLLSPRSKELRWVSLVRVTGDIHTARLKLFNEYVDRCF